MPEINKSYAAVGTIILAGSEPTSAGECEDQGLTSNIRITMASNASHSRHRYKEMNDKQWGKYCCFSLNLRISISVAEVYKSNLQNLDKDHTGEETNHRRSQRVHSKNIRPSL